MTHRIVEDKARRIAGIQQRYTMGEVAGIPAQWEKAMALSAPGQVDRSFYGVAMNPSGNQFDYLTGVEIAADAATPAGMTCVNLPARKYAVFAMPGGAAKIPALIPDIWQKQLPSTGLKSADAPNFERYGADYDPANGTAELWIPVL